MSVPLAVLTEEGREKTGPRFLVPFEESERSPSGSVDERVFGQVGWGGGSGVAPGFHVVMGWNRKCRRSAERASADATAGAELANGTDERN